MAVKSRLKKPYSATTMTLEKQSRAMFLARIKARRALREARRDQLHAAELLWIWSRQNTALKSALVRVAIGVLVGLQTPLEEPQSGAR